MAGVDHWELRPDGSLMLGPVLGWDIAKIPMTALLRLRYAQSEDQLRNGGTAVQVALTARQARLLAQDLSKIADALDEDDRPHGTRQ